MTSQEKSGCAAIFQNFFGSSKPEPVPVVLDERLPYRLRDDFLSPAELNFYRVLQQTVGDSAVVCALH